MKRLEFDAPPSAGSPMLLAALIALSLIITTVWYREGPAGPLHVVRSGVLTVVEPFQIVGSVIASPFRAVSRWASGSSVSAGEVERLRSQNIQLKARLAQLEEAQLENERIRALVKFATARDLKSIGARVIGRPTQAWEGSIVIDRGSSDGVKRNSPVIAAGGLVGQVIEVGLGSAKVRLITDPESGVAVLVQRTRAAGIVRGSIDGRLDLQFVDKRAMPQRGDVLVTSGMGGVFPKGLVVGDVTDVAAPQADLFPRITVGSRVPLSSIEEVLVLAEPSEETQPGRGE